MDAAARMWSPQENIIAFSKEKGQTIYLCENNMMKA